MLWKPCIWHLLLLLPTTTPFSGLFFEVSPARNHSNRSNHRKSRIFGFMRSSPTSLIASFRPIFGPPTTHLKNHASSKKSTNRPIWRPFFRFSSPFCRFSLILSSKHFFLFFSLYYIYLSSNVFFFFFLFFLKKKLCLFHYFLPITCIFHRLLHSASGDRTLVRIDPSHGALSTTKKD
jgi:hypothetical protein